MRHNVRFINLIGRELNTGSDAYEKCIRQPSSHDETYENDTSSLIPLVVSGSSAQTPALRCPLHLRTCHRQSPAKMSSPCLLSSAFGAAEGNDTHANLRAYLEHSHIIAGLTE